MEEKEEFEVKKIIEQPETEIYWGGNGHLVIKQVDFIMDNESIILVSPNNVKGLINILNEMLTEYED
jgi:hypothetical protein